MNTETERNITIDILRVIGTAFVILAHVYPPDFIKAFRNFDVCLLVLISGFVYACSNNDLPYQKYLLKRIKRLCVPSYIAATVIFFVCFVLCIIVEREYPYSWQQIAETFLFIGGRTGGIGYFWIVRIYLIMAIIAPFLRKISAKIQNDWVYMVVIIGVITVNQLIYFLLWNRINLVFDAIIENYVMSALGYASIYMVGIRLKQSSSFKQKTLILFSAGTIVLMLFSGWDVSKFKYPPQAIYLMFGITASLLLWFVIDIIVSKLNMEYKFLRWFSKNSFNIYLSHVLILFLMSWGNKYLSKIPFIQNWVIKYAIIMIGAISITWGLTVIKSIRKKKHR